MAVSFAFSAINGAKAIASHRNLIGYESLAYPTLAHSRSSTVSETSEPIEVKTIGALTKRSKRNTLHRGVNGLSEWNKVLQSKNSTTGIPCNDPKCSEMKAQVFSRTCLKKLRIGPRPVSHSGMQPRLPAIRRLLLEHLALRKRHRK